MALSIKNRMTEQLIRQLAEQTGESMTEAVTLAVRERLNAIRARSRKELSRQRVEALLREFDLLPDLDSRTPDEILGYDEQGLP